MLSFGVEGALAKGDVLRVSRAVIPDLVKLARKSRCRELQAIGTSLLVVFGADEMGRAIAFALDLRDYFLNATWKQRGESLDQDLFGRIAIHTGPVWVDRGPKLMQSLVFGQGVTRTQRIAELVTPNEVFMSDEAHRALQGSAYAKFSAAVFKQIPGARLAGDHFKQELFWVGRDLAEFERAQRNAITEDRNQGQVGPHVSHIRSLESTKDMIDFIKSDIASGRRKIRRIRYALFNGGATLEPFLETVRDNLADGFEVEILAWDNQSARLEAVNDETRLLKRELVRLDRFLVANEAYNSELGYRDLTELAGEYLLLGSRILKVPARHPHHIEQISSMIETLMGETIRRKMGSVVVKKSPFYTPGRITFVDDLAFVSLYLHGQRVGPILLAPEHSTLFERLAQHFSDTWRQATGTLFPPEEIAPDGARPQEQGAHVFISYRRGDAMWAAGRLYDRLIGEYSKGGVFMDVGSLAAASDYRKQIDKHLEGCKVLLALMGPGWLDARDVSGVRRLEDPEDLVTLEISTALKRGIPVLPILLDNTGMPNEAQLPEALKLLTRQHAEYLRFGSFNEDAKRIVTFLKGRLNI
jgi:hypothetical protein